MTRILTCIGCPMGCELTVEVENGKAVSVEGNTCKIGYNYAVEEVSAPRRTVTTTAVSASGRPVPVKTAGTVPKEDIFRVVDEIKAARPQLPVRVGDVILENVCGSGSDVVATKDILP
ncbi:MAG: DUF1667 domain-containing protein [Ruminococcus sp.]|nr:DUF1667 domain-containing protein [Ruminococcus sp.]